MRLLSFLFLLTAAVIAPAQSPPPARTISATEAREFGEELEREFRENGPDFVVKAFDVGRLLDIVADGMPVKDEVKNIFRTDAVAGNLSTNISKALAGFSSYKLLRTITTNQRPQLVFRGLTHGGVNYHILELERPQGPRIRIVDVFVMALGEKMSESLRRLYLIVAVEADRSLISRLARGEGDLVEHRKDIQNFTKMVRAGDSEGALKLYDSFPESLRSEKSLLLIRVMAAQNADEKAYLSAIEDFEKHFPNDPSLALVSIDGFILKKQPRLAIDAIQKLDRFIGGDPYLLLMQARQHAKLKEKDKALELARQAVEREPSLPQSYDFLLSFALEDKDYVETARLLNLAEKNLHEDMLKAIADSKRYAEFLESTPGKKWKEDHNAK